MKLVKYIIFILALSFPLPSYSIFRIIPSLEDTNIVRIAISSFPPYYVYVASEKALFVSKDQGETFIKKEGFVDEKIKHIFPDPYLAETLYVLTERNFYRLDKGKRRLFRLGDDEIFLSAAKYKGVFYLGTTKGVYYAREDLLNWQHLPFFIDEVEVNYIYPGKQALYFSTSRGLYVLKKNKIKRIFISRNFSNSEEENFHPTFVKEDIFNKNILWLGTIKGVYFSFNSGKQWRKLYIPGIDNLKINSLSQTKLEENTLYLATEKGFWKVNTKKMSAHKIFEGLSTDNILWAIFHKEGDIFLATRRGVFKNEYFSSRYKHISWEDITKDEPSIVEVQKQALYYNEVSPEKIKKWRRALKFKALFPNISLSYDKSIWGSSSGKAFVGPRDWGLDLSWDVGELIWNSSEDDVDTRSRLNTQLRLDILDEINRVYFEYLRLKKEILTSSLSPEQLFNKKLRLKELTAILDGYTGGYFSRYKEKFSQPTRK